MHVIYHCISQNGQQLRYVQALDIDLYAELYIQKMWTDIATDA